MGTSWSTQAQDGVLHEVDGVLHEVEDGVLHEVGPGPDKAGYIGTRARLSNKDVELQHAAQRRPTENARVFVRRVVDEQCARQFSK